VNVQQEFHEMANLGHVGRYRIILIQDSAAKDRQGDGARYKSVVDKGLLAAALELCLLVHRDDR